MAQNKERKLRFGYQVQNFLQRFPDLTYDGIVISCLVCQIKLGSLDRTCCKTHVKSKRHIKNRNSEIPYWVFLYDIIFVFSVCNIPLQILNNLNYREFWKKYMPMWDLPKAETARRTFHRVKQQTEEDIRSDLKDRKVWVTVDETTDRKRNKVGNVLVRILVPNEAMLPYVIASKRLTRTTPEAIHQLVIEAVEKFGIAKENILMLVTNGVPYMVEAGARLKKMYPHILHITCLLHTLNCVTETVRSSYPDINNLIIHTKKVFLKAPQRVEEFHQLCPGIQEPPEPVLTRWGTWLEAAFYYNKNFCSLKSVIVRFDPTESSAIKESKELFENPQIEADLRILQENYYVLFSAINLLQNSSISLVQSVEIVENVYRALKQLTDARSVRVAMNFDALLKKNPDWIQLHNITQCLNDETSSNSLQYFTYANITSQDVERSFSNYKSILTEKRTNFKESTVEGVLMMQAVAQANISRSAQ